jgi:hypothetical protein
VSDDRSATEVVHEVRVNDQLGRAGSEGLWRWEQTGLSSGYCLCGWTAGYGQLMPTDVVVTRAAQHLREAVTASMSPNQAIGGEESVRGPSNT